jgi:hypothetical protein
LCNSAICLTPSLLLSSLPPSAMTSIFVDYWITIAENLEEVHRMRYCSTGKKRRVLKKPFCLHSNMHPICWGGGGRRRRPQVEPKSLRPAIWFPPPPQKHMSFIRDLQIPYVLAVQLLSIPYSRMFMFETLVQKFEFQTGRSFGRSSGNDLASTCGNNKNSSSSELEQRRS